MADMPAKIWALPGITRGYWSPAPSKHPNSAKIAYIRADLVEPLVEALDGLVQRFDTFDGQPFVNPADSPWSIARAAIAAYREAAQ